MEGFSTRLRELRKQRNLRQKDLAAVLGLAQTTIANYEQNTRFPDEQTLNRIVDYFNSSLDFLLGRSESPGGIPIGGKPNGHERGARAELSPLSDAYLEALLAGDRGLAVRLVLDEYARGAETQTIYSRLLQPALEEVGRRWEVGEADVYQEHFVSSVTLDLMALAMQQSRRRQNHRGTFLSIVSSGERHEIGVRMATDFLELAGWKALYLGTNLPYRDIIKAAVEHRADVLGLSVTLPENLNGAANLVSSLRTSPSSRSLRILVGGRAFRADPELWRSIGADAVALSAEEAVEAAERLRAG